MRLYALLLFCVLLLWPQPGSAGDLAPTLSYEWVSNARLLVAMRVKYIWGVMDCSKLVWESAPIELKCPLFMANLKRTTSSRMEAGLDGWTNRTVSIWDTANADMFFIPGHTGLVALGSNGIYGIIHATRGRGVIEESLPQWVRTRNPTIKRLVIQNE